MKRSVRLMVNDSIQYQLSKSGQGCTQQTGRGCLVGQVTLWIGLTEELNLLNPASEFICGISLVSHPN